MMFCIFTIANSMTLSILAILTPFHHPNSKQRLT